MLPENEKIICQLGSVHSARDVVPWALYSISRHLNLF